MKKKNVLLITIDCLRTDHVSCFGYNRRTTPTIDELALKSLIFPEAISNGNCTPISFPSILSSCYPTSSINFFKFLPKDSRLISEELKRYGYTTGAFHSNPFISSYCGYNRGFDTFENFSSSYFKRSKIIKHAREKAFNLLKKIRALHLLRGVQIFFLKEPFTNAEIITEEAISWLHSAKKPFFLWVHYMDAHYPHIPSHEKIRKTGFSNIRRFRVGLLWGKIDNSDNVGKKDLKDIIDLYDTEVAYIDSKIAVLLDYMEKTDILDDTIIIITSDHGEEFMEHGGFIHGEKLYDELLRVPLIIKFPGIEKKITIRLLVGLLDLCPTILDLLGLPPNKKFKGRSLLSKLEREFKVDDYVISEGAASSPNSWKNRIYSYRSKELKYIYDPKSGREEAYDLINDHKETNNIIEKMKIGPLKKVIQKHIKEKNC